MTWHALPATQTPVTTRQLRPSSCFFFLIREHLMFPRLLQQTQHGAHKAPSGHPVKIQPSRTRQQPGGNQRPCPLTVTISRSSTSSQKTQNWHTKINHEQGGSQIFTSTGPPCTQNIQTTRTRDDSVLQPSHPFAHPSYAFGTWLSRRTSLGMGTGDTNKQVKRQKTENTTSPAR